MYHQLVLGMSFFDIISSVDAVLTTVMAPTDVGFYQARGNNATCKAQGVLFILGQTSIFYNMSLSIYFWLVVCRNWREGRFRKRHRVWIHVVVCSVGAALALSAIPYIGPTLTGCDVLIPPGTATLWPITIVYTVPLCFVAVVLSVATVATCLGVYRQQKKTQRWMADRNMALSRWVFWQSLWYVLAFWLTIPWVIVTFYVKFRSSTHLLVSYVALGFVSSSQGLLNSLVYFRRQRAKRWNPCFGCGATSAKTQQLETPPVRSGEGQGDTNNQSLVDMALFNAVEGGKQREEEEEDFTEDQGIDQTSDDSVEMAQQSSSGMHNLNNGEAVGGVSNVDPLREAALSAVEEYWELNEGSSS